MSNIAKLKKKAAELEQKKQYDKALELYQQVLDFSRVSDEERDVPLYNRVGDLHFRLGHSEEAISYYEKAVDLYSEGGFFNNAIALCNKILRYSPNRSSAYYKLGLISAKKGFNQDAKQNFLEYADRMQKVGKLDEAFRALKEFADLCPGEDDVRLMLADQLVRADRKAEALEQLQLLYDTLQSEGRNTEAAATVDRMKALDPTFTPKKTVTPRQRKKDGLVFLDLGLEDEPASDATPAKPAAAPEGLELTSLADEGPTQKVATPPRPQPVDLPAEESPEPIAKTPAHEQPAQIAETEAEVQPIELAPLIDLPVEAHAQHDEAPAEETEESVDAVIPTLHDTPLGDPLAGLDVIAQPEAEASAKDDYVDLATWLEQNRTPTSTRMVAYDAPPEDNQQKDFDEMLEKFKAGVARSVDDSDFDSHYDLGIAFREMGLVDEAIAAFQKAVRGTGHRIPASEALGECFLEKGEPALAERILGRISNENNLDDDALIGVLYFLGRAAEELDKPDEAAGYYQRVVAVNMRFRDAARRLELLEKSLR